MRFDRFIADAAITPPAVVIGVFNPTGLGVVRNLARHGVPVLALDTDPKSPGLKSRCGARGLCPDPHYDEQGFIDTLVQIGKCLPQKAVLFPCQDDCVFSAARHAVALAPWLPSPVLRLGLHALPRRQGRAGQGRVEGPASTTPVTAFLHAPGDVAAASREVPFPAVMKSAEHLAMRRGHFGKAVRVESPADLPAAYARVQDCGTIMLQEIIPGGDDQLFTLPLLP